METVIFYLVLAFMVSFVIVALIGYQVENHLRDNHPFKLWWKRHIMDYDPYDEYEESDDKPE